MRLLIINSAEPGITEFAENIKQIVAGGNIEVEVVNYHLCPSIDIDQYDGTIISGSPQGDDIVEHHQPYFQWIRTYRKPILGICAGHHVTGYMHGANYLRSVEPESGDQPIEVLVEDPIFDGFPRQFKVRQMHNDSVTLPDNFIHLAQSAVCYNQAMKHWEKPLYTFQFHPEYLNPGLFQNFINICTENKK